MTLQDDPVHGNLFTRLNDDGVPDLNLLDRDLAFLAVPHHYSRLGLKTDQLLDCF